MDVTLIAVLSFTKNKEGKCASQMHQTKKENEWHVGMKVHVGVDIRRGYAHTIISTAANIHDVTEILKLIREDDRAVYVDSGYPSTALHK